MPFIQANDIKIYYKIFSENKEIETLDLHKPVMIVCHGGMGIVDHRLEVPAWKQFSDQVQIVFPDQRGCGETEDGDPKLWMMDQFGDDIFYFCNALKITKPIVAGISSGGYAAQAYATRYPAHPAALILVNTEAVVDPKEKANAYKAIATRTDKRDFAPLKNMTDAQIVDYTNSAADAALRYDNDKSLENFTRFAEKGFSLISKSTFEFIAPTRANMEMKKQLGNGFGAFNYRDALSKIICRVLWLAGEWDPLHPVACARRDSALIKNVDLKVLQAGAPVYQDDPKSFNQDIRSFFARL